MDPAGRRKQVCKYLALNTRFCLHRPTAVLRVFEIMVGVKFFTSPPES